jgi:hypothetical protein
VVPKCGRECISKQSAEICTGQGELMECLTLPAGLQSFTSYPAVNHPVGGSKLGKSSNLMGLDSEISISPNSTPHTVERQLHMGTKDVGLETVAMSFQVNEKPLKSLSREVIGFGFGFVCLFVFLIFLITMWRRIIQKTHCASATYL